MGMMIPNTNMWVMKIAPPEIRGKEIGKLTTFWFFGQFLISDYYFSRFKNAVAVFNIYACFRFSCINVSWFLTFNFSKTGKLSVQ